MLLYDGVIVEREAFTYVYSQLAKQRSLCSGIPKDCGERSHRPDFSGNHANTFKTSGEYMCTLVTCMAIHLFV